MTRRSKTNTVSRRAVLGGAAAGAAIGTLGFPSVLRAQAQTIKVGVLHPVTGALAYNGQQGRAGALLAIEEINAAGGIKSMGGAKLEAVLADAQSKPEVGAAEIDKLAEAGVVAVLGPFASGIALATTQAAARHNLPMSSMSAWSTRSCSAACPTRSASRPASARSTRDALDNLVAINDVAGKPAKTVVIVHEDGAFGAGMAKLLNEELPGRGFQVVETIGHPTPHARLHQHRAEAAQRQAGPHHPVELPQRVHPDGAHVAAAARHAEGASTPSSAAAPPTSASSRSTTRPPSYIMDTQPLVRSAQDPQPGVPEEAARRRTSTSPTRSMLNYSCMLLIADALERAGVDRPRQGDRGDRLVDLQRPHHAVRADQVRQRPERGRAAGQHADPRRQDRGDLPEGVRLGGSRSSRTRRKAERRRRRPAMIDFDLVVPAVVAGLTTGAIYALVALGLTLIYGVLHIINFAHGSLLMAGALRRLLPARRVRHRSLPGAADPGRPPSSSSATPCSAASS